MKFTSQSRKTIDADALPGAIQELVDFPPREDQIAAIKTLAIERKDLILIAPTGWGKSLVFQAIPAIIGGICLIIMPLSLLEEQQVSRRSLLIQEHRKLITILVVGAINSKNSIL